MDNLYILLNVLVTLGLMGLLVYMKNKEVNFTKRVLTALALGLIYGIMMQYLFGNGSDIIKESNNWIGVISSGYVNLLQMIVIPLVFVSICTSIINLKDSSNLGKTAITIILVLVITTGISALIGAGVSNAFDLNVSEITAGEAEIARGEYLETQLEEFKSTSIQQQLINIIPKNIVYALSGQGASPTLSVVFFSALLGMATMQIRKIHPDSAKVFTTFINALKDIVMQIVNYTLKLTPYGVLALMTRMANSSSFAELMSLGKFIIAAYVSIILVFTMHLFILAFNGYNPFTYLKKVISTLAFAFTSRTSAGTLPLTIKTLKDSFGVSEGIANLSATFGTTMGQNGCAGIYPAMLAVMIAPTLGIDPLSISFLLKLVVIVAISSFGLAGVGGGATFAALTVLSSLGFPVALASLLIAIDPLIDMGRTALNVNDSIMAGLVTAKRMNEVDMNVFNNSKDLDEETSA